MVVGEASIHNIMGGMESTGGVRLHNHKRKLKQRFDIIKKLGQGTYGKVQLGINKETGQEVAIKTIKKCKIETEADLIRIRREIQIMSSVQHPNIIHIYEVFENREKMVLVMEYAAGGELYDYLSERKVLTEHEARRIFRQIATAVFYCHKHKICHRDLKLENILLDQVGNAKIADFGLSNVFDEQRLLNTFCGSPLYASPEIVNGTPYHGPEVDCWSLGVLLYTLVYGAMPFDGSNFKRLVKQISQSDHFEPKKPSPASPLIKEMLTVCPARRADIERICTHWWVNEGYEQNCLDIAEELAAQTPVRLDLLLSLVPQSASAEKLVVGDQQPVGGDVANNVSSEALVPTRCHSVGSLIELDQNSSNRRIWELLDEDSPREGPIGGEAKRKLETTPSMDETAAAGAKRKERSRRKERPDEREARAYKSASRHHSAPIPTSITEEAMEVDPTVSVPISKTVNLNKIAVCLDLIKECVEKLPSKERNKTPIPLEPDQTTTPMKDYDTEECRGTKSENEASKSSETVTSVHTCEGAKEDVVVGNDSQETINLEATQREFKKLKEKALSLDSELSNDARDVPAVKTFERRRSKIFETAEKFNQLASSVESEKPKKIFIPGVNVGGAKRVFERKASLSSVTTPLPAKPTASKIIIDVPTTDAKKNDKTKQQSTRSTEEDEEGKKKEKTEEEEEEVEEEEEDRGEDAAKKRAVDIITGAIGRPPVQRRINGSPPISPSSQESRKLPLKIPVGTNDLRSATVSVSTPVHTKFSFDEKPAPTEKYAAVAVTSEVSNNSNSNNKNDDDDDDGGAQLEEPKMSSKMEITLKSATLPRPRKTSKAEISLSGMKSPEKTPIAFKSEVEAKIDAFQPQKLRTQRSEIAFPVAAAVPQAYRSSSLEPETRPRNAVPKERIIPIQMEPDHRQSQHSSTPPPSKPPPMPQRSVSQRPGSLSRQSTADSDTDSALGSTVGPEPIRKSPREYIIPIAVEGGGYVTPRSGSVEPEGKTSSTPTNANTPRSRFGRPRRMSSLLSDASEDESPFSSLHRDSEDLLQRHMHRLRSSRPSRQPPEHADSLSSGEDDDDDGFELLTAENLFSTLLSRVRSLTQRLNVDDNRTSTGFPSSRLFGRLGSNSSQAFWGLNKPLSRRLSESQFRHSLSREGDVFSRKDSSNSSSNPATPNSPGSHSAAPSTRDTVFDIGSNTLPRDKVAREDVEAEPTRVRKETQESLEQNFTPSLARRLSRTLIEQTRRSLTRSPSASYETGRERNASASASRSVSLDASETVDRSISTVSDETEYKARSCPRNRPTIGRTNSLLEASSPFTATGSHRSPRRTVSLFDDNRNNHHDRDYDNYNNDEDDDDDNTASYVRDLEFDNDRSTRADKFFSSYPRETCNALGRWSAKESATRSSAGKLRKDSFRSYRTDKIQEESTDDALNDRGETIVDTNGSVSECTSTSVCDSNTNLLDVTSSLSARSYETSPTESSSNVVDYKSAYKSDPTRNFENRLLAAENLIKESKLKNLGPASVGKFDRNLTSSYRDTEKCEKRSLISIGETGSAAACNISKRRSCIPSLRLRSGSLTREPSSSSSSSIAANTATVHVDRRKSFAGSQQHSAAVAARALSPEKSLLSKFFKSTAASDKRDRENDSKEKEKERKEEKQKSMQRRISRFLRPDFFDTPREESRYVKEKEAQKAAENERRKSRFIRRKTENRTAVVESSSAAGDDRIGEEKPNEENGSVEREKQREKELKNEINILKRDRGTCDTIDSKECSREEKSRVVTGSGEGSRNGFLHSLEKKLERLRSSNDEQATTEEEKVPKMGNGQGEIIANEETTRDRCSAVSSSASSSSMSSFPCPKDGIAVKRASSVEDLTPSKKSGQTSSKSRVSSVLGLFKSTDAKQVANGTRSQPAAILSKLKRSPTKSVKPTTDTNAVTEDASVPPPPATVRSRIPTKLGNVDSKSTSTRKQPASSDAKRSPDNKPPSVSPKRSPPKEAPKQDRASVGKENEKESPEKKSTGKATKAGQRSSQPSVENGGSATEPSKLDDTTAEKKTRKLVKKSSEPSESTDSADATKKKKIVRVVKKIAKKSSDGTTDADKTAPAATTTTTTTTTLEGKGKCVKTRTKKKVVAEPNGTVERNGKPKENGLESQTNARNSTRGETAVGTAVGTTAAATTESKKSQECQRANRSSLKLDLSKIPQHSFRNTTPKRDSPKSDSPKNPVDSPKTDELLECLSKVTHRASITGNKIVIDKAIRARDVAELKREVTECARLIESHATESTGIPCPIPSASSESPAKAEAPIETANPEPLTNLPTNLLKESPLDYTSGEQLLSPMDEPLLESFDSWSVSSAELSHARPDLHSPTSPSHSLSARNENSESVIDRIRRRSFYSRFNDRRRPSLTAPPPGVTFSTSATLPRKFSFSGHREHRDRSRYGTCYGLPSKPSRHSVERNSSSYSLYGGDSSPILRNRSLDRGGSRYSDMADLKSPTADHLSLSSSYDPLRRYLRSPTFDLSASRTRYHSVDFTGADSDLTGYRVSPLTSLLLNDTAATLGHGFSSSLPRKYRTVGGTPEPKTVEYYEELLAPSTGDYLPASRSPISTDYFNRYENGYYNGNLELQSSSAMRKTYAEDSPSANGTACDTYDHRDHDNENYDHDVDHDQTVDPARRRSKGDRVSVTRHSVPTVSTEATTATTATAAAAATTTTDATATCTPDNAR